MSLEYNEEKTREFLQKSSRPLIVISKNPSGDVISSALALFWTLRKTEKTPQIVCADKISQKFSFLTGYDLIEQKIVADFNPDLIFVIGSQNLKSLGKIYFDNLNIFSNLPIVNFDYHNLNENFGTVNPIDLTCVSVSEVVAKIIETASFLEIDNETANLLLVGIIEKTNNLQSTHADSEVACLAEYLLHLGARRNEIVKCLSIKEEFSKLKQILITASLVATAGIFLFQLTIFLSQFAKDSYGLAQNVELAKIASNLNLQEALRDDGDNSQVSIVNSKKIESEEFSGVFSDDSNNIENKTATVATTVIKNPATGITENKELPQKLEIPKLGIKTRIQHIGLDANQKMKVPSNNTDVAWFDLGPKPGEIGSAVIVGHLDTKSSRPAVFWNLHKLKAGDDIFVIDGNNNKKRFQVVSSEKYETGIAPMEKIFGANDGAYLNLITCGGVWDKTKNNYTERFVVFTEYVL